MFYVWLCFLCSSGLGVLYVWSELSQALANRYGFYRKYEPLFALLGVTLILVVLIVAGRFV